MLHSLISSAQGNIVTPKLTTAQPPFTISLTMLDHVDVIMIDAEPHLVHTEIVNLGGVLNTKPLRPLADVYPFHIIGGHLSLHPYNPGFIVLAAEITDNQIQAAVTLEFKSSGNSFLSLADLVQPAQYRQTRRQDSR
ncbi:MAG: hypothetical protein WAM14_17295 [Candidatus Nitrosopolaris sp.]